MVAELVLVAAAAADVVAPIYDFVLLPAVIRSKRKRTTTTS